MTIAYKTGDLLSVKSGIIAHGCNMHGVMGSGVAKQIKAMYPEAFETYQADLLAGFPLGSVSIWSPQKTGFVELLIANCLTQQDMGSDGKKYVSYDAVDSCFAALDVIAQKANMTINIPKIGAGLGGGDWGVIESIINHRCKVSDVMVWEYNG